MTVLFLICTLLLAAGGAFGLQYRFRARADQKATVAYLRDLLAIAHAGMLMPAPAHQRANNVRTTPGEGGRIGPPPAQGR